MKKRLLAIAMTLAMTLSLLPVTALAEGMEDQSGDSSAAQTATSLPEAQNGVITLTKNVTLESGWTPDTSVTLDLNGEELTLPRMDVLDGIIITITDNSGGDTGKITATGTTGAIVWGGGTLILEKGTITSTEENLENGANTAVFNMGTFTINDGNIQGGTNGGTGIYNTARNGSTVIETPVVCNINGGEIEASFGICAFGLGVSNGDLSTVENDRVTININNGTIKTNGQGIATNASSGRYAGFTVNMRGGAIVDMDGASTGMYLPAIGVTNITGGTITAAQGIRIGAGELNISGGTITCTAVANGSDLRPGGSGGTTGAIVVGKASGGYVGDIEVNVSDSAVIENTAAKSEDPNAVYPTIVVSDKNMADSKDQPFKDPVTGKDINATFDYSETSTSVTVDAQVKGDIVKTSTLPKETASENDGGNTKLEISGGTVTGNVINQTRSSDLNITGGTVTGNVTNESEGSVGINGASVTGDVTNAAKGEVLIENNSTITGTVKNESAEGEKGSVAILDSTVGTVTDDQDIVLVNTTVGDSTEPTTNTGNNEAMIGATAYESLGKAIENAQPGNTIKLLKDITVEKGTTADYNGVYQLPAGVTLDGNHKTITAKADAWNLTGSTGSHIISVVSNDSTETTTIKNLTIVGHSKTKAGILAFGPGAKVHLENVDIQNCGTVGVQINSASVTAENLKTSGNAWGGINLDVGSGQTAAPAVEITGEGTNLQEANAIYSECKDNNVEATINITVDGFTGVKVENDPAEIRYTTNVAALVEVVNKVLEENKQPTISNDDFVASVDGIQYTDFAAALSAVKEKSTITLLADITVDNKITISANGVTLNGNEKSITVSTTAGFVGENKTPPVNSVLEITGDNVTVQDVKLIGTDGKTKHGVQFYEAEGGKLSGVTVTDTAWTGVLVNGSKVTIEDSALNPSGEGVYATIEYAMGDGVTTIPEIALNNVSTNGAFKIWADNDTVTRVTNADGSDDITDANAAAETIRNSITTTNNVAVTVSIEVTADQEPVDTTKPSTKPTGSGSTRYTVTVSETAHGAVKSSHTRASRGTTVTLTVTPDEGYELASLAVYDADGDEIELERGNATRYTFTMPRGKVTVEASFAEAEHVCPAGDFTDVSQSAWYHAAVDYVLEQGIMSGVSADRFGPEDTLTRAMAAQMLWALEDKPVVNYLMQYGDVAQGAWYAEAVRWASAQGVMSGYSAETFGPEDNITREQLALILFNYADRAGYDVDGRADLSGYADEASVSGWAVTALEWAVGAGLISGREGSALAPAATATRAEVAQIFMNFLENVAG